MVQLDSLVYKFSSILYICPDAGMYQPIHLIKLELLVYIYIFAIHESSDQTFIPSVKTEVPMYVLIAFSIVNFVASSYSKDCTLFLMN